MSFMKKLRITETQYDRLTQLLSETPFNSVIKNTVKRGDTIQITYKNTTSNFKVIQNDNGQIVMDNIDAGSANINYRYFITFTSLQGDDLTIRRVHKTKEGNKLNDVKSWTQLDVKDITNIEVLRDGKIIDTVDTPVPSNNKTNAIANKTNKEKKGTESENFKDTISDLLAKIANAKQGQEIIFTLNDGKTLKFYINAIGNHKLTISLDTETSDKELNSWESFVFGVDFTGEEGEDLYEKNKKLVSTPDGGDTINFRLIGISGEKTKDITIKNIKQIDISDDDTEGEENNAEITGKDEIDPETRKKELEIAKQHGKAVYDAIMNNKDLRKAFFHQPTLFGLIKNGDPVGIVPAEKLLSRFFGKRREEKFGKISDKFKRGSVVEFKVLDSDIVVPNVFVLPVGKIVRMMVKQPDVDVLDSYRLVSIADKTKNEKPYEMYVLEPVEGEENTYIVSLNVENGVTTTRSEKNGKIIVLNYSKNK